MRPAISLADALRALVDVDPRDDEARQAVLECMGLEAELPAASVFSLGAWQPTSSEEVAVVQRREAMRAAPVAPPAPSRRTEAASRRATGPGDQGDEIREGVGVFQPPAWMTQPGESLVVAAAPALPHPHCSLFGRLSQRGLLSSALGTLAPEGEIDVDAIIAIGSKESTSSTDCLGLPCHPCGAGQKSSSTTRPAWTRSHPTRLCCCINWTISLRTTGWRFCTLSGVRAGE